MTNSNILQQASSLFWIGLLCLLFNTAATAQSNYSGEELFRAVYFGQGTFAEQVPELNGVSIENFTSDAAEISGARQFQDQVVALLQSEKPGFFGQFRTGLYSGNHVTIRNQLQNGKSTLYWATSQLGETRDPALEAELVDAVNQDLNGKEFTPDALRTAVENHLATKEGAGSAYAEMKYIRYIAYIFIIVYIEWYFDPEEDFSATYQDKLVNSIANKLN